jgi:hypothetical protein
MAGMLAALLAIPPAGAQPAEPAPQDLRRAQPTGALSGATVFVSPGHGWLWNERLNRWVTQRGNSHGVIEDHSNAEAVLQFLVPYLWNAGANVVTTRERDMQTNMVIVEAAPGSPGYAESGPWSDEAHPAARDGRHRVARTIDAARLKPGQSGKVAKASFTPDIPEDGHYAVYAWYNASRAGRTTTAAEFVIQHTGGTTIWQQDLNRDFETWKYLGTYHFRKGARAAEGSVLVTNATGRDGDRITVDAIRFGGGMGESGYPRWEESGLYYAPFMGYRPEADSRPLNSVNAMPFYASWECEPWEKDRSVYVSWHTNAHNGTARGLFSFVYGPNSWGGLEEFSGIPGGDLLGVTVHNRILGAVHADWDPQWRNGNVVCRWLGETNPRNNTKMPAALYEMGFHDNVEDAGYILDPRFRQLVARAVYQGIVRYYAEQMPGFDNATFLPEPPTHLRVLATTGGRVTVAWNPPPFEADGAQLGHAATGYRLYRSRDGKGFDTGMAVEGTTTTLGPVPSGETLFVRVTATNAGGESLPTETLAVRHIAGQKPRVLVVNGFDRLDRGLNLVTEAGVERGILAKMNTFDYVIQHADGLAAAGYPFESAGRAAVRDGQVSLAGYDAVVWMLGQQGGEAGTLDAVEREAVRAYLGNGGTMLLSGSEIAADLTRTDDGFLRGVLHADFVATDAGTRTAEPVAGSIFADIAPFAFGGDAAVYPVKTPDVLAAAGAARAALNYAGGKGVAAVQVEQPHRLVVLGFPIETIEDPQARRAVISNAMRFLDWKSDKRLTQDVRP